MSRTKISPSGYTFQLYRGAGGFDYDKLVASLPKYKTCGVTGIAPHGFTGDLDTKKFDQYAQLAQSHGMSCYAAFGLGPAHPFDRGVWIGKVAQHSLCRGVLFDIEGAFEIKEGKQAAIDIGRGFVSQFQNGIVDVWTCDQPWADPAYHWSMFPWEEIASYTDARAAQFYFNDWKGPHRYIDMNPKFHHDWDILNTRLARTNSVRPLMMTLQAYGWSDIFPDYVDCLMANPTAFLWCDKGLPTANSLLGLEAVTKLRSLGYTGAKAVQAFQASWNAANPTKMIATDNRCGYNETLPLLLGRTIQDSEKIES